jgi:hypothetical protein
LGKPSPDPQVQSQMRVIVEWIRNCGTFAKVCDGLRSAIASI